MLGGVLVFRPLRLAGLALAWLCVSATAAVAMPPEYKRAQSLYEYGDFQAAIPLLEQLVLPGRLEDEKELVAGHRMLAVSYYSVGRKQEAAREFRSLFYLDPDSKLDPFLFPPDVVEFHDNVKAEVADRMPELREMRARERAAKQEKQKVEAASQAAAQEKVTRLRVVTRRIRTVPYPLLWLPLGIPQFLMGHWIRGALVLALQLVVLAPSPFFFLLARAQLGLTNPFGGAVIRGADKDAQNRHHLFTFLQYASIALIPLAYVAGVVDAHILPTREMLEGETIQERRPAGPGAKPSVPTQRIDSIPATAEEPGRAGPSLSTAP